VIESIDLNTVIKSDGSTRYSELKNDFDHRPATIPKKEAGKMLPWVHKAISDARILLLDVHHKIDDDFLQNYLNAYVFKLNRRYFIRLLYRALFAGVEQNGIIFGVMRISIIYLICYNFN
jgi:hypothetical protein